MNIKNISITRALTLDGWKLEIEVGAFQYTGVFEDMQTFIMAVSEAVKFFAVRHNLLRAKDAGLSRVILPGDGKTVLPGDVKR
jgi:hypothetical protein